MILILHGDNLSKSREILQQVKEKLDVRIPDENLISTKKEININDISPQDLANEISAYGLFSDPPFIILDISDAGRKNLSEHIEVLKKCPVDVTIIVLSNKTLSKANAFIKASNDLKAKVLEQNVTPTSSVYKFTDALFEKNRKKVYVELKNLIIDGEELFYVFAMILYSLRSLATVKLNSKEASSLPPFVKSKLGKQINKFTDIEILNLYKYLYEVDKKLKLGQISPEIAIPLIVEKVIT